MSLRTDAAVAEEFGLTLEKFHELRRQHKWPHVRLGRFEFRFTEEQVAEILAMQSAVRPRGSKGLPGQTVGSARRSA